MKLKKIFALCISAALILTGCIQKNDDVELSEEEKELLDRRFQIVIRDQGLTGIKVTYYKKDSLKEGGSYETITGHLEKFSSYDRTIVLGGTVIALDDISAIEGELFEAGEADLTS